MICMVTRIYIHMYTYGCSVDIQRISCARYVTSTLTTVATAASLFTFKGYPARDAPRLRATSHAAAAYTRRTLYGRPRFAAKKDDSGQRISCLLRAALGWRPPFSRSRVPRTRPQPPPELVAAAGVHTGHLHPAHAG